MLLSLPHELRDMIIDQVLLRPDPAPQLAPSERPEIITSLDEARLDISPPPIPPFRCSLAEVCHQLRAETLSRIPKLQIPLVLDVLGLKNGYFRYTWLSRPWGPPSKWGRIPQLTIQIRTRPVDVRFWPDEKPLAMRVDMASHTSGSLPTLFEYDHQYALGNHSTIDHQRPRGRRTTIRG
jgi:hypothetical protein